MLQSHHPRLNVLQRSSGTTDSPIEQRLNLFLGAGYDQVDVPACTARGIHVSNVPTAVDDATADTTMFLILGALRNYNSSILALRKGDWRGNPPPPLGRDPQNKVLGILGMGGIGRNLKKKAEAFGMHVQYHNRSRLSEELSGGAKYCNFDELLSTSDVISLNLPLNVSLLNLERLASHSESPEKHSPYHQHQRVREDEAWRRHRQYGSRRRYGRGCSCESAGQRNDPVLRSRRLRRGTEDPSRSDRQPASHAPAAHGYLDGRSKSCNNISQSRSMEESYVY